MVPVAQESAGGQHLRRGVLTLQDTCGKINFIQSVGQLRAHPGPFNFQRKVQGSE